MPIEMSCPFCQKGYKLKDELAGKKVTCANVACRRAFQVPGTAQNAALPANAKPSSPPPPAAKPTAPASKQPPPKASSPSSVDADAEALAALNDDPAALAQEIEIVCTSCDHKWPVGLDMQGKNVLCPECRHRQKVPIQKDNRRDWRVRDGAPSLAKQEKLEGVQASADVGYVSGEALKKTGVIVEEFEPRPLRFWFLAIGVPVVALGILIAGILNWRSNVKEDKLERFVAAGLQDLEEGKDLPTAEAPLFRAAARIAAGEFSINRNDPEGLKEALNHLGKARQELDSAPPTIVRDLLIAELAALCVQLGGAQPEIEQQIRIRWVPAPAGTSRAKLNEKTHDVQAELLSVLKVLRREDRPASIESRMYTIRRLAKEFTLRNKSELVDTLITGTTFFDLELNEARATAAAEIFRISGKTDKLSEMALMLKTQVQGQGPPPFQALCLVAEPPVTGVNIAKLTASGDLQDAVRLTHTWTTLLQKKPDEALAIAKRGGPIDGRAKALALLAETVADPLPVLEASRDVTNPTGKGPSASEFHLTRLGIVAVKLGQQELADVIMKGIRDDRAKAWLRGEGLRQKLLSGEAKSVEEAALELPQDPKDYRAGLAWGRLAMARNNARVTGQSGSEVLSAFDRWGKGSFKTFGLLGLAIGLQDRDRSGIKQ